MIQQRDYQQRIVSGSTSAFLKGARNVLIESPAGSGKTVMAFSTIQKVLESAPQLFRKPASEVRIGWTAIRRNLLAQAEAENKEKGFNIPNISYISMFDSDPDPVDFLIIDEAQHDAANSARHVYRVCDPRIALGLSATPFRTDRMQLCFDKVIKDAGYHRLIQDGWLSQFDQYMLNEYTVDAVANAYLANPAKWGKSMMYFPRITDCYLLMEKLQAGGVRCDVVTGETDRYAQIDKFENGELDVLINVYVLTEGFDCPDMKSVFVRDSSKAPTIQMAGRVLRKHPEIPVCNIVQSAHSKWPFTKTAKPNLQFLQTTDGSWLSVGTNDRIETTRKEMLQRLATTRVTLPPLLIKFQQSANNFNQMMNGTADSGASTGAPADVDVDI